MTRRWIAMAALALVGCGEERLGGSAADRMHRDVEIARASAREHDRDGALEALSRLERRVRSAAEDGRLSDDAAAKLRTGVAQAKRRARRDIAEPQPAPEPVGTPEALPGVDDEGEGDD